jgi:hypothetical protein
LARRSSRTSFSSSTIRCWSLVGDPRSQTTVDLRLLDPVAQCFRAEPELHGDARHHAMALAGLPHGLLDDPDRPLSQLSRVSMS